MNRNSLWIGFVVVICTMAGCAKDPIETAVGTNDRAAVAEAVKADFL